MLILNLEMRPTFLILNILQSAQLRYRQLQYS